MASKILCFKNSSLENRRKSESLAKVFVRSDATGKLISLSNLVEFEEVGAAKILSRFDRTRAVTISARLLGNYSLSKAIDYITKVVRTNVPEAGIEWKGESEEIQEASKEIYIIFALALVTAFLVLAANFNSFLSPFVIFLTVPLALFGGLLFLNLFNSSINIFSQIALVILIGMSVKNANIKERRTKILIESPNIYKPMKVPINETGSATAGTITLLIFPKKRK